MKGFSLRFGERILRDGKNIEYLRFLLLSSVAGIKDETGGLWIRE
jgi:hypothetical protein